MKNEQTASVIKRYTMEHLWLSWECVVEIDEVKAAPAIKEMVEFWSFWEDRLEDAEGDYTKAFLCQLAREIFIQQMESRCATAEGLIRVFSRMEGWVPLDGSQGIKIVDADSNLPEHDDFSIKKHSAVQPAN